MNGRRGYLVFVGPLYDEHDEHRILGAVKAAEQLGVILKILPTNAPLGDGLQDRKVPESLRRYSRIIEWTSIPSCEEIPRLFEGGVASIFSENCNAHWYAVAVQSLAVGTPIVVSRAAPLANEIRGKKVGRAVPSYSDRNAFVDALAEAVKMCETYDGSACRTFVHERPGVAALLGNFERNSGNLVT